MDDLGPTTPEPPRRRSTLATATAFVVLAAAISTTAIAVSSATEAPASILRAAPASTESAGSARMTSKVTMTIDGGTLDILDVAGVTDFRTGDENLVMTSPAVRQQLRLIDHVEYLSTPLMHLPHGAHWLRVTPHDLGRDSSQIAGMGSSDPSSGLAFLSADTHGATSLGKTTLDGVPVTHYKFDLDLTTLTSVLGQGVGKLGLANLQSAIDQLSSLTDLRHLPGEAWIDASNRVRRFAYTLVIKSGGTTVSERSDSRFTDFGVPVVVHAPDSHDVVPFSAVPDAFQKMLGQPAPAI